MRYTTASMTLALVLLLLIVAAAGGFIIPLNDRGKEQSRAPEHSPVIGENFDLDRIDFIHYAKPANPGKPAPKTTTCYKLMGLKLANLPVTYTINTANQDCLLAGDIFSAVSTAAETWDTETTRELFSDYESGSFSYGVFDGKNAIAFGPYSDNNVIAVTSVWYYRTTKEIVEFDMLFNEKFTWGTTGDSLKMDLQNIATHEFGHAVGLADLYTESCIEVTMYGYSGYGDIGKRSLEAPDIAGLQAIYGM